MKRSFSLSEAAAYIEQKTGRKPSTASIATSHNGSCQFVVPASLERRA